MPTVRRRGTQWQAQVRRHGFPPQTRTFGKRSDALVWARQTEAEIDRLGLPTDYRQLRHVTLGDVLRRYEATITPTKRSAVIEGFRLRVVLRDSLAAISLAKLTSRHISEFRDRRLEYVSAETVRKDLSLLRHALDVARRDFGIPLLVNPAQNVTRPSASQPRSRRLNEGEWEKLTLAWANSRNDLLPIVIKLAVATGMRRGELLNIRISDIDFEKSLLRIPVTKTGQPRIIPLASESLTLLRCLKVTTDGRLLPLSANALRLAWNRLTSRAEVTNLHFHDLRHEAISRFFERGLSVPEVALISGHRDPRMLFRYTHLRAEDVAKKLDV